MTDRPRTPGGRPLPPHASATGSFCIPLWLTPKTIPRARARALRTLNFPPDLL